MNRSRLFLIVFFGFLVAGPGLARAQAPGLNPGGQAALDGITRQISTVEWLAPLAPLALSPFFGITLLSGLACYGPEWLPDNALLNEASPLAHPVLFWTFLTLTILTSLPRFSKVSKPVAQVADFLETWAAIIILVAMKLLSAFAGSGTAETALVVQAGVFAIGYDLLVAIAMAINIIVINSVKFFFELLVWVTPVPALDACFEVMNKTLCAALIGIYAVSPLLALTLNVIMFAACLLVFGWVRRREIFFRSVLFDYVLGKFNTRRGATPPDTLTVFPAYDTGPIKRRSRCRLEMTADGYRLMHRRWLRGNLVERLSGQPVIERDWWTNSLNFDGGIKLTFTTRYNQCLPELAGKFGATIHEAASQVSDPKYAKQIEFI